MKKLIIVLFFLLSKSVNSQTNLLPNPSFEFTTTCPFSSGDWNACANWNNVNMNIGAGLWGTPDYYHACGTGQTSPPNVFSGICTPQSGLAMMSIVVYNMGYPQYREYIASPLTCPMLTNSTYTLSFWLSNGTGFYSPWTIQNIGAYFSVGPLSQSGFQPINVIPQCEITSNVVSTGWTLYTFTVQATAAWNYITIGAFRSDANNNVTLSWPNPGGPASAYANYYIDNISVTGPQAGSNLQVNISSIPVNASICAGQNATLIANGASSYSWSSSQTNPSIIVNPNVSTIYTVTGTSTSSCGVASSNATILVNVVPQPTISFVGGQSICRGQSATITATGAQSYNWSANSTSQSIIISPTLTSVYTVTGTTSNCSTTNTIMVNVLSAPTLSILGKNSVCRGASITLTATGANTYSWTNGGNSNIVSITPTSTTIYTVTGSVTGSICIGNAVTTVSVSECTGIEKVNSRNVLFNLTPNPFNAEITIEFNCNESSKVEIKVFNSLGTFVVESVYQIQENEGECKIQISISESLPKGMYFFQVNQSGKSTVIKGLKL